jgi:hypothetical protein
MKCLRGIYFLASTMTVDYTLNIVGRFDSLGTDKLFDGSELDVSFVDFIGSLNVIGWSLKKNTRGYVTYHSLHELPLPTSALSLSLS